jgi:hypothetical protein
MAKDIETIPMGTARAAIRLCNIPTGKTTLLDSHKTWLDGVGKDIIAKSPNPWVDLFGYASHLGNPTSNQKLSNERCDEVMRFLQSYNSRTGFPQEFGYGDSRSSGGRRDDDGHWRAVEVYVYGSMPPGRIPRAPVVLPVPKEWFVTNFSGQTWSVIVGAGFTAITGHITFERPNGDKYTCPIGLFGASVGLSYVPGALGKLLNNQLLSRFPALAQFLAPESAGLSNAFMQWLMSSGNIVARLLWNSPRLLGAINALKAVAGGASGGGESWWSAAVGIVYGSRGRELQKADFNGSCICYAITGTVAVGGFGTYVLFFGLDPAWKPWVEPEPLVNLMALEGKARGVAVISAASVAAQIPGLGAGATVFWGEIT